MNHHTPWQRRTLREIDQLTAAIARWPHHLGRHMAGELRAHRRLAEEVLDTNGARSTKAHVTRTLAVLRTEIDHVIISTPAERIPGHQLAYNGDAQPQRGELTPLQRDIVCRAITHEIQALGAPYPDGASVPPFLAGLAIADDDAERPLLREARALLSPRTDDARAAQAAAAHDAAAFPGGPA